ncbi:MAG TPA: hypothetical protein VF062_25140 [Candidatus Limnocylindrales bacterium]
MVVVLLLVAACARNDATPAALPEPADADADVYAVVLRRYLTHGNENSFPDKAFAEVYVLDRADPRAADPMRQVDEPASAQRIPDARQSAISAALADLTKIRFVASRDEVVVDKEGCAQVRDGGILITLAPPVGGDDEVRVGINGFVACLGATWLTYVVKRSGDGGGWTVTGTTGEMAVS